MSDQVEFRIEEKVALIGLPEGRGHGLSASTRDAIADCLIAALEDEDIHAIVILGQRPGVLAGVPFTERTMLSEAGVNPGCLSLSELCEKIENAPKPVVMAMRGLVQDGAFELALAAHARVAGQGARVQLRYIDQGGLPLAGATQRLPQRVGSAAALGLLLSGNAVMARDPRLKGLLDVVTEGNVIAAARAHALSLSEVDKAYEVPPGMADPMAFQQGISARRQEADPRPEAQAMISAVEAAQLLPIAAGLEFEAAARADVMQTPRCRALFHYAATVEMAWPGMAVGAPVAAGQVPAEITIFGDGKTAEEMAIKALEAGFMPRVAERRTGGATRLIRTIAEIYRKAVDDGQMDGGEARSRLSRIQGGPALEHLEKAEFIVEASDAPLARVEAVADLLVGATGDAKPVVMTSAMGLHAGKVSHILTGPVIGVVLSGDGGGSRRGLMEVMSGPMSDAPVVGQVAHWAERMGYVPAETAARDGVLSERLRARAFEAVAWCLSRGAKPEEIDAAGGWLSKWARDGMAPQLARSNALDEVPLSAALAALSLEAGGDPFDGGPDGALGQWMGRQVHTGDPVSPAQIGARIEAALVSAAFEEMQVAEDLGRAGLRASMIDLVMVQALGMEREKGGAMFRAEGAGWIATRDQIRQFEQDAPHIWQATPLLDQWIRDGVHLAAG